MNTRAQTRQGLIAKIHIAKKALGMDDDGYREFLFNQTGKRSAKDCTEIELDRCIAQMKRMGFVPQAAGKGKRPTTARRNWSRASVMAKITAQLATRGLHWNYAHGMGRRMFKKERLEWLDDEQLHKVMIALQVDQNRRDKKEAVPHEQT